MVHNAQTALLEQAPEEHGLPEKLWHSRADLRLELSFVVEFNRDLNQNARLTRLNENYIERRMEQLDKHVPICRDVYELTRARLHELLLLCAANYANNCEYGPVGDLMFNPRLTLVHVRGGHEPVVKERHVRLSEQFRDRAATTGEVLTWLKEETALETKKKPLIPHSYEILETCRFLSKEYLDSAQDRAVQIADLSAFLCIGGFEERVELDTWLRRASQSDRALTESRLIPLDWSEFRRLGAAVNRMVHQRLGAEAKGMKQTPAEDSDVLVTLGNM